MPKGSSMFDIPFLRIVDALAGPGSGSPPGPGAPAGPGAPPAGPGSPPGGLAVITKPGVGTVPIVLNPIGLSVLYSR